MSNCICEALKNSGERHTVACEEYHKMKLRSSAPPTEIHIMGKEDPVLIGCPECGRMLKPREDGRLRLHAIPATSDSPMCKKSGSLWDELPDPEMTTEMQVRAAAIEPSELPADPLPRSDLEGVYVFRAAERVREQLEKAREGNYLKCWTAYAGCTDVEALLLFVERHRRG